MKKCVYCGKEIPKKERKWWTMPLHIMNDQNLVCNDCHDRIEGKN